MGVEEVPTYLIQYGVLGIWTTTLLWQIQIQNKIQKAERAEHVDIIKNVSSNLALLNDNVKQMSQIIVRCQTGGK